MAMKGPKQFLRIDAPDFDFALAIDTPNCSRRGNKFSVGTDCNPGDFFASWTDADGQYIFFGRRFRR